MGISFPPSFVGLLLIWLFAIGLGWLPAISNGYGKELILARLTRSSMLDVLSRDLRAHCAVERTV